MYQGRKVIGWLCKYGVCVVGLFLIAAISVSAQLPTGTILGVVKDATGGTVAGATVAVTNTDTGLARTGMTGDDGAYRFPALPVGNYEVTVMKDGFQTIDRKGITLVVGQEAAIDITLQVGSTGQTVTVTEEAPQVNTTGASNGGTVDEERVEDLPLNGRNFVDLSIMQAGVTQTAIQTGPYGMGGTMYSSNGATLRSNNTMLDGAIMTTLMGLSSTSAIFTTLGIDGIKEYKIVTSMFGAEYGMSSGSQTTIVSKGGTNQWHGDGFEYLRNSMLDARNTFATPDSNNVNGDGTNKLLDFPGSRIPPYHRNNFGGSFGGPIKKDKIFFYGVYEGLIEHLSPAIAVTSFNEGCFYGSNSSPTGPFSLNAAIPLYIDNSTATNPYDTSIKGTSTACTAPGTVNGIANKLITVGCPVTSITATGCSTTPAPTILTIASLFPRPTVPTSSVPSAGFNYSFPFLQPSNENYEQLRFDQNFNSSDSAFLRYTVDNSKQFNAGNYPQWYNENRSASYIGTASETHILTSTLLNTVRLSFSRTDLNLQVPTVPLATAGVLVAGMDASTSIGPGSGVTGFTTTGNTTGDIAQNVLSISDDIFWTKGKHALKFGTLINMYAGLFRVDWEDRGTLSFGSNPAFFEGDYSSATARAAGGDQDRLYNWKTLGFYVQDDYRILPRVTVNLGLRYEFATTVNGAPSLSYTVVNPSASPTGEPGPLYLNNSLHDFSPRLGFAWDVFGDGKTSVRGGGGIYYDIANPGSEIAGNATGDPTLSKMTTITNSLATPTNPLTVAPNCFTPVCPNLNLSTLGVGTTESLTARVADYHMAQPTIGEWTLAVDHQLPLGFAITAAYVGSKGWHIKQTTEGNPTVPLGYGPNGLPYYCVTAAGTEATTTNSQCTAATSTFQPRTNPAFGLTQYYTAGADTYYDGLQLGLNKRIAKGLQFQVNYTFSKNLDDGQKVNSDSGSVAVDGETIGQLYEDKGPAFVDVTHNVRGNLIYHAPNVGGDKAWAKPLHGWWFGSIISYQTGFPINVIDGTNRSLQNNTNISDRPNLDPSYNPATVITGNRSEWFNPSMFDLQPAGTLGNVGRDSLRGPKLVNEDLSFNKDTRLKWLGEQGNVEFRAEIFNIWNHANYGAPNGAIWSAPAGTAVGTTASGQFGATGGPTVSPTAGAITSTVNAAREIQLALKFVF